jgi:hypothetical protein
MVEDKFKQAQTFRTRAGQLRSIASALAQQSERELLVQLAGEYEEMARSAFALALGRVDGATNREVENQARRNDE